MRSVKTPALIRKLFPSIYWKKNTSFQDIYLTFDDGPSSKLTPWLLDLLDSLCIKATFFCVGKNCEKYPSLVSEIIRRGHGIGNHTYSHKNGFINSTKSYWEDIEKCAAIIPQTSLFRPPYGNIYPWQIKKIQQKYDIIMWDVLSYDFQLNITKDKLKRNILSNIKKGSIIVLHDSPKSEKILRESLLEILIEIKKMGFRFKLLSRNTKEI